MKFFNSRIVTTDISLEDAVKKAQQTKPQEAKSLDELIADIDAKNRNVKTAATTAETKTAEVKPATEVKVEVSEDLKKEAKGLPEALKEHQFKAKGEEDGEKKEEDKEEDEDEKEKEKEKEDAKCAGDKCASTSKTLKIAKSLDFRGWEAEDVVKAWDQHSSLEGCIKNVTGHADDPKMYCGLLQVASQMAKDTLVKKANAQKKHKKAEKSKSKGVWKVLAKLTDKERSMLDEYWRKLYGDYYVDAMLADY